MVTISRNLNRMTSTTIKVATILEDNGSLLLIIRDLMTLVEAYRDSTHLDDPTDMSEIIRKMSELIDNAPETKVHILTIDAPIRNGLIMKPILGVSGEEFLTSHSMNLANDNIRLESTDNALAIAQWEQIGAERRNDPAAQLSWSKSGRLLSLQSSYDHMGIGIVDGGRLLSGISLPYDGYYSIWGSQLKIMNNIHRFIKNVNKNTGRLHHPIRHDKDDSDKDDSAPSFGDINYYRWQLHNITVHEASCWAPDRTLLVIDGSASLAPNDNNRTSEKEWNTSGIPKNDNIDYNVITSESNPDSRADLISMGATLIEKRNMFGWAPKFLLDAEQREDENDKVLEYEFDLAEDLDDTGDDDIDTIDDTENTENSDVIEIISDSVDAIDDAISNDGTDVNVDEDSTGDNDDISEHNDSTDNIISITNHDSTANTDAESVCNDDNDEATDDSTDCNNDEPTEESGVDDELIISDDASYAEVEELMRGLTEQ